ncbi:hypothetical protein DENSPDRAFT_688147 [Dentipellis sp. KUC8613]|nr:hypothetical protein DENSPDRAFT_688147 [Dentipellis sp. KUC8613]
MSSSSSKPELLARLRVQFDGEIGSFRYYGNQLAYILSTSISSFRIIAMYSLVTRPPIPSQKAAPACYRFRHPAPIASRAEDSEGSRGIATRSRLCCMVIAAKHNLAPTCNLPKIFDSLAGRLCPNDNCPQVVTSSQYPCTSIACGRLPLTGVSFR